MSPGAGRARVAVVGAGVVGLAVAWELLRAGCLVDVFDDAPGEGATQAAAGMLAPVSEAAHGERALLRLGLESLSLWPGFAARLEAGTGAQVGLRGRGTLLTAHDADDARELRRFAALLDTEGLEVDTLTGPQVRALEPALSPRVVGALSVPGDHSVDNRRVAHGLLDAVRQAGGRLHRSRVALVVAGGRVTGVRVPTRRAVPEGSVPNRSVPEAVPGGRGVSNRGEPVHGADVVVIAAGAGSPGVTGLPERACPPVRPVKGQILRLRGSGQLLERTVRARVGGRSVYLVPRDDGELVVGATSEDVGHDTRVTAGGVLDLLRRAVAVVPDVAELELAETLARLRPASPDNAPVIGWSDVPGLLLATGHHRGGVLLAPATAEAVRDLVLGRPTSDTLAAFAPQRFSPTRTDPTTPSKEHP